MKPSQRAIYADRIERVVAHLAARLAEAVVPDLHELAVVACLSDFHFHRVFRLMTGETLASTVQRLRLAISLPVLAAQASSVTAATATAAYATTQAYTRALQVRGHALATGTPRDASQLANLLEQLRRPPPRAANDGTSAPALQIEIVSFEPLRIIALRNVGDYAELNRGYERLFDLLPDRTAITGLFGIPYDDSLQTPASECRFDCCVALSNIGAMALAPVLRELSIGGGHFARLRQKGPYDSTWSNLDLLYSYILDGADRTLTESPPFIHYLDDRSLCYRTICVLISTCRSFRRIGHDQGSADGRRALDDIGGRCAATWCCGTAAGGGRHTPVRRVQPA